MYALFWKPIVQTYMKRLVSLLCKLGKHSFAHYVEFYLLQSVLFAGFRIDLQLLPRTEKGFAHTLWPIMTVIPKNLPFLDRSHGVHIPSTHGSLAWTRGLRHLHGVEFYPLLYCVLGAV